MHWTTLKTKILSNGGTLNFIGGATINFGDDSAMASSITNGSGSADVGEVTFNGKAVIIKPIVTHIQLLPALYPNNGGNNKFPAPKNNENNAKPVINISLVLFIAWFYLCRI
mgnify:CR=1 FL=1